MIKIFYLLSFDLEDRLFKRKVHEHTVPQILTLKGNIEAYISPLISAFPLVDFSASSVSSHPFEEKQKHCSVGY